MRGCDISCAWGTGAYDGLGVEYSCGGRSNTDASMVSLYCEIIFGVVVGRDVFGAALYLGCL